MRRSAGWAVPVWPTVADRSSTVASLAFTPSRPASAFTARPWGPVTMSRSTSSGDSSAAFSARFQASVAERDVARLAEALLPGPRPGVAGRAPPVDELLGGAGPAEELGDDAGAEPSSPTRRAAAPSPLADSSPLVGRPERRSDATTSTVPPERRAAASEPTPERTAPPVSMASTSLSRRRAAWMAVALVLSRYAGSAVANHSASGAASPADRSSVRAASTPIVVVSSS